MKKLLLTFIVATMALASQAAITVYVKADVAPYIWAWNAGGNVFAVAWPGPQLTEKTTVQGTEFWYYTFDESITNVGLLFNNGEGKQTKDVNGITTDRYFIYDGTTGLEDVTTQYGGEVPDAKVETLTLKGNQDGWAADVPFTVVEAGKTFSLTYDLTGNTTITDGYWQFKIRPNAQDWVGYSQVTITDQPAWLEEARSDGNFQVDLEADGLTSKVINIVATWGGGKQADENWTMKFTAVDAAAVQSIVAHEQNSKTIFNLQGQRISNGYKGIVVLNGKKYLRK
jgi:hypothetical protein